MCSPDNNKTTKEGEKDDENHPVEELEQVWEGIVGSPPPPMGNCLWDANEARMESSIEERSLKMIQLIEETLAILNEAGEEFEGRALTPTTKS